MAEEKKINGWADVVITPEMPLNVIVNFMNILNQRLVAIEDNYQITFNGQTMSLTELYRHQAEEQSKQMAEAAKKEEKKAE